MKRLWVGLIIGVLFQYAAMASVKFKSGNFTQKAEVGKAYRLNLLELLEDWGAGPLNWAASPSLPSWLSLDSVNNLLSGTPTQADAGSRVFRLTVVETQSGASANITLTVRAPVVWDSEEINLGIISERSPFVFDLKVYHSKPADPAVKYSCEDCPKWITLSKTAVLSGLPAKEDVGPFGPLKITINSDLGTSTTSAFGEVVAFNDSKPNFKASLFELRANASHPFLLNLNSLLTSSLTGDCQWAVSGTPSWIQLDAKTGVLSGTPNSAAGGTEQNFALAFQCKDYGAMAKVHLAVDGMPGLSASFSMKERQVFSAKLPIPVAEEGTEAEKNEFVLLDRSDWVTVFANGELEARPLHKNVGEHNFRYQVTDERGVIVEGVFQIHVASDPRPPVWAMNPIRFEAKEKQVFSDSLSKLATSPDGEALTFSADGLPKWLILFPTGALSGTPTRSDVGEVRFSVMVSNSKGLSATSMVLLMVKRSSVPPLWNSDHVTIFSAIPGNFFSYDLSAHVTNPDSLPLTFSMISGPSWISLSVNGILSGTPGKSNLGANSFVIRLTSIDGEVVTTMDASIVVMVIKVNEPAQWIKKKIRLPSVMEGQSFCTDLSPYVKNQNGLALKFSKKAGAAWMTIKDQFLCGSPTASDLGLNRVELMVSDGIGQGDSTVASLTVIHVNHAPAFVLNPIVLAANAGQPFKTSLASYVVDPDGDTLTCLKRTGPAWVIVSADLSVSGTPTSADAGENKMVVLCTDSNGLSASTNVIINVLSADPKPLS